MRLQENNRLILAQATRAKGISRWKFSKFTWAGRNEEVLGGDGYARPFSTSFQALGHALEIRASIQIKLKLIFPSKAEENSSAQVGLEENSLVDHERHSPKDEDMSWGCWLVSLETNSRVGSWPWQSSPQRPIVPDGSGLPLATWTTWASSSCFWLTFSLCPLRTHSLSLSLIDSPIHSTSSQAQPQSYHEVAWRAPCYVIC